MKQCAWMFLYNHKYLRKIIDKFDTILPTKSILHKHKYQMYTITKMLPCPGRLGWKSTIHLSELSGHVKLDMVLTAERHICAIDVLIVWSG